MHRISIFALAIAAALSLATAAPVLAQDFLFDVDSVNFGEVPVGLKGLPVGNRTLTITNNTNSAVEVQISFNNFATPEDFELMDPDIAAIRQVQRDIYDAIGCYRQDYAEDPNDCFTLAALGYLRIEDEILWEWHFDLIGHDPITQIFASRGNDYIIFDLQLERFHYRIDNEWIDRIDTIRFSEGNRQEFTLNYSPSVAGAVAGWLTLTTNEGQTRLPISGTGYVRDALTLSSDVIEFGDVYLGRRISREISFVNTAGNSIGVHFFWQDIGQFSLYKAYVKDVREYILLINAACIRYHIDHGEDPHSVEELTELGYVPVDEELDRLWTFSLIGSTVTEIEAVSTGELRHGAGHVVLFDVQTSSFQGYGEILDGSDGLLIGVDRSENIYAEFSPEATGENEAVITLQVSAGDIWREGIQEYTLRLTGSGMGVSDEEIPLLPTSLTLSTPFPSPFNSSTVVSYSTPFTSPLNATLVDISGRELTKWTWLQTGQGSITIDGACLATGEYWLRLEQDGNIATTKLVLVR